MNKLALVAVLVPLALFGCSQNTSSPQETAEKYMESLVQENWDQACQVLDSKSRKALEKSGSCQDHLENNFSKVLTAQTSPEVKKLFSTQGVTTFRVGVPGGTVATLKEGDGWRVTLLNP